MKTSSNNIANEIIRHFQTRCDGPGYFYSDQYFQIKKIVQTNVDLSTLSPVWIDKLYDWSVEAYGPGKRATGILAHIRKELNEVEAEPEDPEEWVDIILLALNGLQRLDLGGEKIIELIQHKVDKNKARSWPDWRTMDENTPIEHVK